MKFLHRRRVATASALGLVAVGLAWAGLLLPLLTAAAVGGACWLVVTAWGAEPVPGTLPPPARPDSPAVGPDEGALLRDVLRAAHRLPEHALADPQAVDALRADVRAGRVRDVRATAVAALTAVGR